jgi:hypothetical protein
MDIGRMEWKKKEKDREKVNAETQSSQRGAEKRQRNPRAQALRRSLRVNRNACATGEADLKIGHYRRAGSDNRIAGGQCLGAYFAAGLATSFSASARACWAGISEPDLST